MPARYLVTAVIGVKGTNVISWPESSRVPGYPRANTLREDSLAGSLVRDAIGGLQSAQPRAPPGGGRWRGTDAPVIADPARPAGQLAAPPGRPGRGACRSDRPEAAPTDDFRH